MRIRLAAAAALVLASTGARADTVEVSSTTMLMGRQEFRLPASTSVSQTVELRTVVPLLELLSLSARDIQNPVVENLQLELSTWGGLELADHRWQPGLGQSSDFSGDLDLAYVRGDLFSRALTVRLGRQHVVEGNARMLHLDGVDAAVRLPANLGISGYFGKPVASRFDAVGTDRTTNPTRGDYAGGGRVSYLLPGWFEAGASFAWAVDHGELSRQDLGGDLRITPLRALTLNGFVDYSLYEARLAEGTAMATWQMSRKLSLAADYSHLEPDLFLPRDSILAVFSNGKQDNVGGTIHLAPCLGVGVDGIYHALFEPGGTGHDARLKGTVHPYSPYTTVGGELRYLHNTDNGYSEARLFGGQELGRLALTLDLQGFYFEQRVNGERTSLLATATAGYDLGGGFRAQVSAAGGATPFVSDQLEFMAKLVYNQTYHVREVR
ncbi:hypothetical protein [Anaeromyxobacter paludicola]|uniref:Alginate export domain-containing protein n=1 Tax=Anaeromyxobacter paludicola TaxID=2918171 RepID=A0ABN6NBH3_9BACT|nr:hypothetical protein [Anaeromyxobacter paludicola]BDG10586.1 hypothetical protein AMPC_36990 [Anaeromyxobacter paludicola]